MVALNPLAEALNEELEAAAPEILEMLSALGKRAYFPRGILSQTAEAKAEFEHVLSALKTIEGEHADYDKHATHVIEGWSIRVEKKLLENEPELAAEALSLAEMQLRDLGWVLPQKRIEELEKKLH